ncbi:MAG: hypothetical protein GC165_10605 [Armatimonadetes bacterium]|nr:hypothetical protein [Armatimonadota bacterium]
MAKLHSGRTLRIADEVFLVVATLHHENPAVLDFSNSEILEKAQEMKLSGAIRAGFMTHVSSHCVANKKPSPDNEQMLFATGHGRRRLLQKTDVVHPMRNGRIFPNLADIDPEFFELVEWAKQRYESSGRAKSKFSGLLGLAGTGRELWANEHADEYVARLRSDWE